jgi:hypothetical protein
MPLRIIYVTNRAIDINGFNSILSLPFPYIRGDNREAVYILA